MGASAKAVHNLDLQTAVYVESSTHKQYRLHHVQASMQDKLLKGICCSLLTCLHNKHCRHTESRVSSNGLLQRQIWAFAHIARVISSSTLAAKLKAPFKTDRKAFVCIAGCLLAGTAA